MALGVRARFQQLLDNESVALGRREDERRHVFQVASVRPLLDRGARLEQDQHGGALAGLDREHQRRAPLHILRVHVGARPEQTHYVGVHSPGRHRWKA